MALETESTRKLGNAWNERLRALKNIPPVLRIVWESGPAAVLWGCSLRVVAGLVPLSTLAVTRWIIDAVVAHVARKQPLTRAFWWYVGLEFGLASLGTVLTRAIVYCDSLLADKYIRHISVRVMEHASRVDLPQYEDPSFHDRLERARVQATDRLVMIQAIGNIFQQAIITGTLAASIIFFSPWLLLILVAFVVPAFLGDSHFAFLGYALNFQLTPIRRELDYLRTLGASKESAKELKLFGMSSFLTQRYKNLSDEVYHRNVELARPQAEGGNVAFRGDDSRLLLGVRIRHLPDPPRGDQHRHSDVSHRRHCGSQRNIQMMFSTFSGIADQALFLTDLLAFFAVRPTITSPALALPAPRPIRRGFEFDKVSFAYPGASKLVLDNICLRIEPGERIALIGENGQGKTTLVKLLTRLYDPISGRILLDGADLREYDLEDLYSQVGVIFQDFMRYDMTAEENIAVGKIDELHNPSRIALAAAQSHADAVIRKLPGGYKQMLGRRFDGGLDLSGGEWQKIALARAYLRDAQVLILDEPTASLDARSESEVFERFAELTEGKTALLISHRFSTVRMADRILVLEGGRIAEQGSHHQLMSRGGRYSEMFELQAANYR